MTQDERTGEGGQRELARETPSVRSLKVDASFEDAVRRAMQVKKPEGGFPDFRTRQRRGKGGKDEG